MNDKLKIDKAVEEINKITNRISSKVPEKHTGHPKEFKAYLQNELRLAKIKLDNLKGE